MNAAAPPLDRAALLAWLREDDPARLAQLWAGATAVRRAHHDDIVHLRGLIEISNRCVRRCAYCGMWSGNKDLQRYLMKKDEILACAARAVRRGYGSVVLQSGEDPGIPAKWLADAIAAIKAAHPLAVTLGMGERELDDYALWRRSGADRALLRFETSDAALRRRLHPPLRADQPDRLALLPRLRDLGYEIGGGFMVGLPGQSYETLADDLELCAALDLDMIGIGPYLPCPDTPLGRRFLAGDRGVADQVPNSDLMTLKALALARLLCPEANIPATTALAVASPEKHLAALRAGANVIMPNLTPPAYRRLYHIYPDQARAAGSDAHDLVLAELRQLGLRPGAGPGGRPRELPRPPDQPR